MCYNKYLKAQASLPSFLIITFLILIIISTLGYSAMIELLNTEREKNISYDWSLITSAFNEALIRLARDKDINDSFNLSFPFGTASATISSSGTKKIVEIEANPQGIFSFKKKVRAILNIDKFGVIKIEEFKEY